MSHYRSAPLLPGVAFITGGGRGLGLAIAQSFAKEGARGVVIFDIQPDDVMAGAVASVEQFLTKDSSVQPRCIAIRGDVTKEADLEAAVAQTVTEFGRLDYSANFAGIVGPLAATWDIKLEDWKRVIEVNTVGVWLSMKVQLAQMLKQDPIGGEETGRVPQKGSIVNCASVNSIQAGAGTTGYSAAKHAVLGLTKAAALEARGQGVRINCVSPGFLLTKLLEPAFKVQEGQTTALLTGDAWSAYEKRQGRKASFEEVGDVVALLSSQRMSLVVGHNLVIDGGFTVNENPE
ncbi:hypothetical protein H2198_005552 [Neophaeococcomyces mojaviensis]|uniref:Uncharacterized protein n=1 Tax=Neophaeococcomyces mojaviensis TaxID=3383035 RepID=A0ACC3A5U7_9EURO|nr:hypothetical protein H2198_005552 [Knufia sp. JES_112]